ncbi:MULTISPECIES: EF-hand domain-containing protein [unclassified Bradyrhizobium]|uniref:EF-hand domain-containing protein n=1 Tax=unclassified Bradyrhizobium TaxID=2631580 RepID=UPI0028E74354|nr:MULTISPECIES: EF-hand domain-containing protein [unclassified Bradyrhizobium]
MWFALGAASSVLEGLQSLGSTKSGSGKSGNPGGGLFSLGGDAASGSGNFSPWSSSGSSGSGQIAPETMSALLAAQSQSGSSSDAATNPLQDLFSQIDGDGDGQITRSEFETALGAGGTNIANADKVFGKLDSNSDGNVSMDELTSALQGARGRRGHHHHQEAGASAGSGNSAGAGADALMQALSGASSSSSTNSDGSTTTTITYADGSKMTLIMPATTAASNAATSSYNMIEKLMQHQSIRLRGSSTTAVSA